MLERIVKNDANTEVKSTDEKGPGGACHNYEIACNRDSIGTCATVRFQRGPIQEVGVNGCTQEDLLEIVIDRLRCFQEGEFRCRENALALTNAEQALLWLKRRTENRRARGVEGRNVQ